MTYTKTDNGYIIKLKRGEKVIKTLTAFCSEHNIHAAHFNGIGAVNTVEMGYYSLEKREYFFKKYSDDMEVVSMTGNVVLLEGKPFLHTHAVLSDTENLTHGGHVKEATVAVTLEIFMTEYNLDIKREYDDAIGLNLLGLQS